MRKLLIACCLIATPLTTLHAMPQKASFEERKEAFLAKSRAEHEVREVERARIKAGVAHWDAKLKAEGKETITEYFARLAEEADANRVRDTRGDIDAYEARRDANRASGAAGYYSDEIKLRCARYGCY